MSVDITNIRPKILAYKDYPNDVGRTVTDIASALFYPELAEDMRQVLRMLIQVERQISFPDGNWFAARILLYRTLENVIDDIVIAYGHYRFQTLEARLRDSSDKQ